jgi:hypothetical protein
VTNRWSFFVDESGDFDDPDDVVVVTGVLMHQRASLQPHVLKAALRRALPVMPWPPHAWLLNQPAFTAVAIREIAKTGVAPANAVVSAGMDAWRAMKRSDAEAAQALVQAFRIGVPDGARAEIKSLSTALRNADPLAFDILRHYGAEVRALLARLLTEMAHQERVAEDTMPVWLVLSSETKPGDAVSPTGDADRFLALLRVVLERLVSLLRYRAGNHEVVIWVSRRNVVSQHGATERLSVPHLERVLRSIQGSYSSVRLFAGGVGRSTDERGAGYVIADFAANASRVAVAHRGRALEAVHTILRERFGTVQITTREVYSHCAASGDAAALIERAQSESVEWPERELPPIYPRARWACEQAWMWIKAMSK